MDALTYWQRRIQRLNKELEKDEAKLKKRLSSFYNAEANRLDKEIAAYYQKYGTNNVIEYRELLQSLSEEDKNLLMQRMEDFAKKYPEYAHLMPVRASVYKLDRLEGLQYSVKMQQLEIGAHNIEELNKHLKTAGLRAANSAAEALGFGTNFYAYNSEIVKQFINIKWSDGKSFSDRIWGNGDKLAQYLNTDIAQGIARGDSYAKLAKNIKARFDRVSRRDINRLLFTEGTYVTNKAQMTVFEQEFDSYKIITRGDGKVCDICQGLEGIVFSFSEAEQGINFPPIHPWCRCSHAPAVEDWDKWIENYVNRHGGEAEEIAERLSDEAEFVRKINYNNLLNKEQKRYIIDELKSMPPSHRTLARPAVNDIIFTKEGVSHYDRRSKVIYILENPEKGELIHEIAHALETELDLWNDEEFIGIVKDITDNKTFDDIVSIEGYDERIKFIQSKQFISDYQGRMYEDAGYYTDDFTALNPKALGEYFTEGYKCYVLDEEKLKLKDLKLFNYIKKRLD